MAFIIYVCFSSTEAGALDGVGVGVFVGLGFLVGVGVFVGVGVTFRVGVGVGEVLIRSERRFVGVGVLVGVVVPLALCSEVTVGFSSFFPSLLDSFEGTEISISRLLFLFFLSESEAV